MNPVMKAHFFITGGTGLVGTFLLPRLLRANPDSTATLLVRGENQAEVDARVHAITRQITRDEQIPDAPERIDALRGDVAAELCGLSAGEITGMIHRTTHIIHGAATIRFDHPIDEARAINCGGTLRMLALARRCADGGRLERFVYIGTSSVSGRRSGLIYEHELEMGQQFFNTYEQSKCESERIVRGHFDTLPITIFRPSIIIGDSRTGRTSTFNVIYIPLRLVQKGLLTAIPGTPATTLDLVPIDWVDDAMVAIMSRSDSAGKVYHLTAGPHRAARLGHVVDRAAAFFDAHTPLAHPRNITYLGREEFVRRTRSARGREEALMSQLDTLLPYISIDRLFDSANTDEALRGSGIEFPSFDGYADRIFRYCVETNWGKNRIFPAHRQKRQHS
jgi:thioester reductase-like protein